jgi:hypothetical protein
VSSYLAISPLLFSAEAIKSGLFSATLSVNESFRNSLPLVSQGNAALWCSDFPLNPTAEAVDPAIVTNLFYTMTVKANARKVKRNKARLIGSPDTTDRCDP